MYAHCSQMTVCRRHFDIHAWLNAAIPAWRRLGLRSQVRVELIEPNHLPRLWTDPQSLDQILSDLVTNAIEACLPESLVEIEVRLAEETGEWISFIVRDWAGGRNDGWRIDPDTQQLAKRLEGHIDVANHPGRSTACALFLPTGILKGWLRRQSDRSSVYHVSWPNSTASRQTENGEDDSIDQAVQTGLYGFGSMVPLGDRAYLLSSLAPIDRAALDTALRHCIGSDSMHRKRHESISVRIEALGRLDEFIKRMESSLVSQSSLVSAVCEPNPPPRRSDKFPLQRIDPPAAWGAPRHELAAAVASSNPIANRVRPRRAGITKD